MLCGLSSPENTGDSDRKIISDLISRMAETSDTSHLRTPAFYINALSKVAIKIEKKPLEVEYRVTQHLVPNLPLTPI